MSEIRALWMRVRRHVRLSHAVVVLCALLVAADGGSTFVSSWRAYHRTLNDAGVTLDTVARAAELTASRTILDINETLAEAERAVLARLPGVFLTDASITTLLRQYKDEAHGISNILVVDAQGAVANAADPIDQSREQLSLAMPRPATMQWLYIGSARRSAATGAWSILVGHLLIRDGEFVGLLAAEVPTAAFSSMFTAVAASGGIDLALLLEDGTLIASGLQQDGSIGRHAAFAARLTDAVTQHNSGLLTDVVGPAGGGSNLLNYRRLPTAPLLVELVDGIAARPTTADD